MISYDAVTQYVPGPAGRLAVLDHGGAGRDVLLLHGANRNLMDWEVLRPHLRDLRLVAMDLRGHGLSDEPSDTDYGFEGHLADVDAVCACLGLATLVMVGHLLGGTIAVRCAATGRSAGIVDLDGFSPGPARLYAGIPAVQVTQHRAAQMAMFERAAGPETVDAAGAEAAVQQAHAVAQSYGWDAFLLEAGARRNLVPDGQGGYFRRPPPGAVRAMMDPLEGWDMFADLAALTVPALIVRGGRTPPVQHMPPEQRELTEALVAGIGRELSPYMGETRPVRAVCLEGAGHMIHFDAPAEVAQLIRTFIER